VTAQHQTGTMIQQLVLYEACCCVHQTKHNVTSGPPGSHQYVPWSHKCLCGGCQFNYAVHCCFNINYLMDVKKRCQYSLYEWGTHTHTPEQLV